MNTPVEALEYAYPFRIARYAVRRGSGGEGGHRGGDGICRDLEVLSSAQVTILSERRTKGPYGLQGGEPGYPGNNRLLRDGQIRDLPSKCQVEVQPGDVLQIETPGGGGYGKPRG